MSKLLLVLGFIIAFSFSLYIPLSLVIGQNAEKDTSITSDAIFVLGARSYRDGQYNPCLKARVDHAINLYHEQKAKKLIFSGGTDLEDNQNEAETMKKIAIEQGIPENDILLEKAATSTFENFTNSQSIFKSNNIKSIIIVTEPFHTPRALLIAKKLNVLATVSPATQSSCWTKNKYFSKYFLKEPLAIFAYKLQSKI